MLGLQFRTPKMVLSNNVGHPIRHTSTLFLPFVHHTLECISRVNVVCLLALALQTVLSEGSGRSAGIQRQNDSWDAGACICALKR